MKMANKDDMKPEYSREELGKGVRGKFYRQYQAGSNIVVLDPDVAKAFPSEQAVNDALRAVLQQKIGTAQ